MIEKLHEEMNAGVKVDRLANTDRMKLDTHPEEEEKRIEQEKREDVHVAYNAWLRFFFLSIC